jgi:hypothetical protein
MTLNFLVEECGKDWTVSFITCSLASFEVFAFNYKSVVTYRSIHTYRQIVKPISATMCPHCLFPVVVTSLEQIVISPCYMVGNIFNTRVMQLLRACWNNNNLLRACWPRQPCYKMTTTCSRIVNNWEQAGEHILLTNYMRFVRVYGVYTMNRTMSGDTYGIYPETNCVLVACIKYPIFSLIMLSCFP